MLSAHVFEKRFQKASGQQLLMIFDSFWDPIWTNFDPGGTLGGSLGLPWGTFGPRPQKSTKNHQKDPFLDLILDIFFHQVFCIFHAFLNYVLGSPPNHVLMNVEDIWDNFWSRFPNFLKTLETLKNATSPMRNHCFWVSRGKVFHHFSLHFSRQVLEPAFYRFLIEF